MNRSAPRHDSAPVESAEPSPPARADDSVAPPLQRLSDMAAAHMARLIETGVYGPGEQLPTERDLAEELGVSRTAIREAFRALQALGLVEAHVGRGRFVTEGAADKRSHFLAGQLFELHTSELRELSEVRELVETAAIRHVPADRCGEIAAQMASKLERATQALAAGDLVTLARLDGEFHTIPLEACANRALRVLASGVLVAMGGATREVLSTADRAAASLAEHRRIVAAFESGDIELAALLTGNHQNSSRHRQTMARATEGADG